MSLYLYLAVLFICVSVAFVYRNALNKESKYLFWLVCITLIVELVGFYYLKVLKTTATWIFHFYQPIEYVLIAAYFHQIIQNKTTRKYIISSIPVVVVCNIINTIFFQGLAQLSTYTFLLAASFFCIWSIVFFIQLLQSTNDSILWSNPNFWITTGILFFYSGCFFQMGFSNYIKKENLELAQKLYIINHLLNMVLYGMFTYGFICQTKYRK